MKFFLSALTIFTIVSVSQAQDISVEKSIFGVQTGFLGAWVHNEAKLTNSIALRSEIGLDFGFRISNFYTDDGDKEFDFLLVPVINLEPRWYYNLNKRKQKSKNISNNSGNFLSLKTSYLPGLFVISDVENAKGVSSISAIPTWGIRRSLGKHFNFETGFGLGVTHFFNRRYTLLDSYQTVLSANLHLRIGYQF